MNSPFKVDPKKQLSKGIETGDVFYHTADIIQVIKNDEIHLEVVDNKELIQDVIDVNANRCGLKNILALYQKTGDVGLFNQQPILNNFDATKVSNKSVKEIVKDLPDDLIGDQSIEQFLANVTAEAIAKYYRDKNKKEVKEDVKEE